MDQGYMTEIGSKILDVPVIGDFEVSVYGKSLEDKINLM